MIVHKDLRLSQILWYKIGGVAQYVLEAENKEGVVRALDFIEKNQVKKFFVVGLGSNLLFSDDYYEGAVIRIVRKDDTLISQTDEVVEAFAGDTLDSVITYSLENNLVGLEWAGGLPGTVGAAIRGNVGAFGGEVKDTFHHAEVLKYDILKNGKIKYDILPLNRRDIKFSYRTSTIKIHKNLIVISSAFKMDKADTNSLERARQTYYANIEYRNTRHPMDLPSNGSAFKNINNPDDIKKFLRYFRIYKT